MASPVTAPTITFDDLAIGTVNPIDSIPGLLPDGQALEISFTGVTVSDGDDPTSPSLSGSPPPSFSGPVSVEFSSPVSAVSFDAGQFNQAGSTKIEIIGRNGFVVTKVLNPVSAPHTYSHFSFDFGENAIDKILLTPVGDEASGFAFDNLSVTLRPESRAAALSGTLAIDNLLHGTAWNGNVVSFSFIEPDSRMPGYGTGHETFDGSKNLVETKGSFNAAQRAMAKAALNQWSAVSGLTFSQVNETPTGAPGMIRFDTATITAPAQGFYPGEHPEAGDVNVNTGALLNGAPVASFDYLAFMHEVGHALGLKHPHDAGGLGVVMPADQDSLEFSVMSYRSYPGEPIDGSSFKTQDGSFPQSLMMDDIAAIQYLYGANFNHNSGDNRYVFDPTQAKIFETIWDGGGTDTYDMSKYDENLKIDLRPGRWSVLGHSQLADLKPGAGVIHARGSVFNALQYQGDPRSLIENAIGGNGDDRIIGNQADNRLEGHLGKDLIEGLGGRDQLFGNQGDDTLLGGSGNDTLTGGTGHDDMTGGPDKDTFVFNQVSDSLPGDGIRDMIEDFIQGEDSIDVHAIDADSGTAGVQHFTFIGTAAFSGAAQIDYRFSGGDTIISANVNANLNAEFQVELHGQVTLTGGDFILA